MCLHRLNNALANILETTISVDSVLRFSMDFSLFFVQSEFMTVKVNGALDMNSDVKSLSRNVIKAFGETSLSVLLLSFLHRTLHSPSISFIRRSNIVFFILASLIMAFSASSSNPQRKTLHYLPLGNLVWFHDGYSIMT